MLHPVHEAVATVSVHTKIFTTLLASHLVQRGALKRPKRSLAPDTAFHRPISIVKLITKLKVIKNKERENFVQNPKPFLNAMRMHYKTLRAI